MLPASSESLSYNNGFFVKISFFFSFKSSVCRQNSEAATGRCPIKKTVLKNFAIFTSKHQFY